MMMKNQQVTEDGKYEKRVKKGSGKSDKLQYMTMLSIRAGLVAGAGYRLAHGVTIATRYSCVRHQGFKDTSQDNDRNAPERCVMDYQNQQYRLLKQLSLAYAFLFTGKAVQERMIALQESLAKDASAADDLPELHAISSGLKALCTFEGAQGLEDCRKCCGGHGVLMIGGVAQNALDYVTYNTAEGDRIVLELQSARYLLKALREAGAGKSVSGLCEYVVSAVAPGFDLATELHCSADSVAAFQDLDLLLRIFRGRALSAVVDAGARHDRSLQSGVKPDEAWNSCAVDLVVASRAHCWYTLLFNFVTQVHPVEHDVVRRVLTPVYLL